MARKKKHYNIHDVRALNIDITAKWVVAASWETFNVTFADGKELLVLGTVWDLVSVIDEMHKKHGEAVEAYRVTRRNSSMVTEKRERLF